MQRWSRRSQGKCDGTYRAFYRMAENVHHMLRHIDNNKRIIYNYKLSFITLIQSKFSKHSIFWFYNKREHQYSLWNWLSVKLTRQSALVQWLSRRQIPLAKSPNNASPNQSIDFHALSVQTLHSYSKPECNLHQSKNSHTIKFNHFMLEWNTKNECDQIIKI